MEQKSKSKAKVPEQLELFERMIEPHQGTLPPIMTGQKTEAPSQRFLFLGGAITEEKPKLVRGLGRTDKYGAFFNWETECLLPE